MPFKKLATPIREFGFWAGLAYIVDRVLSAVSPRTRLYLYELMVQPIPDKPIIPERFVQSLTFREIAEGDPEIDVMPALAEIKKSRFEQGAVCLGAWRKGELIGYVWFAFGEYEEDEVRCTFVLHPENTSVFDFDLYLFPEHRMGLGFASLWEGANRFLRERGVDRTFSRLTRFNIASRRAHSHLGWQCVGKALFLKLFQVEFMAATLRPYIHISLRRSNRVRIVMQPPASSLRHRNSDVLHESS